MLPFDVVLGPGDSPYRQIVYAATRAVVSGELPAGTPFPSVRELSQAVKVNPNTAHKVVAELVRSGLLEVHPGVGTVVARTWEAPASERRQLLSQQVEALVVEAKRLGLEREAVMEAITETWDALSPAARIAAAGTDDGPERGASR